MKKYNKNLEELLLYSNKLTKDQKYTEEKLDEISVKDGYITDNDIMEVLESQMGIPHVDLEKYLINPEIVLEIPENIAKRYDLIAIDKKNNYLIVAMADPLNFFAIDDIKIFTKFEIQPVIAPKEIIRKNIDKFYRKESTENMIKEFKDSYEINYEEELDGELLEIASAPIVKLINSIIEQALDMRASDIHIEPYAENIRVRFRVDGDLHEIMRLSSFFLSAIITRIKIMGKMNIAEKRIPQDGRVETKINGKEIDIRISTMPTVYGEKIVLRLLDKSKFMFSKDELGFNEKNLKAYNKILEQPYGIILVTGPAGSGKTTTLYATLKELNRIEKNIITVEDPVESKFHGINQVQVNPKAGLTFASGLRSILRQDPDIIMVGEIRDSETAEVAIRAAITGHLVLSTLHTNDSASSIIRLIDMGIEPYLVSSAVIGVVSQRLVKELCPNCRIPYDASYSEKSLLGLSTKENITLYRPNTCNKCNNGYKGRRAVHEIMIVNETIRELIDNETNIDELRIVAKKQGMISLLEDAVDLALKGKTTVEEVLRAGYTLG